MGSIEININVLVLGIALVCSIVSIICCAIMYMKIKQSVLLMENFPSIEDIAEEVIKTKIPIINLPPGMQDKLNQGMPQQMPSQMTPMPPNPLVG